MQTATTQTTNHHSYVHLLSGHVGSYDFNYHFDTYRELEDFLKYWDLDHEEYFSELYDCDIYLEHEPHYLAREIDPSWDSHLTSLGC